MNWVFDYLCLHSPDLSVLVSQSAIATLSFQGEKNDQHSSWTVLVNRSEDWEKQINEEEMTVTSG